MAPIASSWPTPSTNAVIYKARYYSFMVGLNQLGQSASDQSSTISNFDTLEYWYNFGNGVTYWQCLNAPQWVTAFNAIVGVNPNPLNCYFVCTQGGSFGGTTFTNALAKDIKATGTDTVTAGFVIPPATYAGGYAYLNVTAISGSGVVTVTGLDERGSAETWTVTATTTGTVLLVPSTHSYSLITKVTPSTGISTAGGITSMTAYVESHAPAGRTFPPT